MTSKAGNIYVGIGGWTYAPWRGLFYPPGLSHAKELEYAGQRLTSIEINGTFYRTQTPATFRKWAREVPDGFVFSVKGPRFATNRRVLAEAGDSIEHFLKSGVLELGDRLGPLLWQFAPTKKFDADDFRAFLALLPHERDGRRIRHVVEVRHASFATPALRRPAARVPDPRGVRRARDLSGDRRRDGRLRLCPAAEGRRRDRDRLSAHRRSMSGRSDCPSGPAARSRATFRAPTPGRSQRPRRATYSPT